MYEVHQREWNSGNKVAVIFKSKNLQECIDFRNKWEQAIDKLYEGTHVGDECCYFASVYNTEKNDYLKYLIKEDGNYHKV